MAMVITSSISDVMEGAPQNDFSETDQHSVNNNKLDIPRSVSRCDSKEEARNEGEEAQENIEENLRNICHPVPCDADIDNDEEPQNSKDLADNNYQRNEINLTNKNEENESGTNDTCTNEGNNDDINEEQLSRRLLALVDNDSEDETDAYETSDDKSIASNGKHLTEPLDLQHAKHKRILNKKSLRRIDSESDDDLPTGNVDDFSQINEKTIASTAKSYQHLIDSESEEEKVEEEEEGMVHKSAGTFDNADTSANKDVKEKPIKKRTGSIRASKNEAMRQIHSETQRLLRESKLSLPYHRPKQRTLQEFLNRKKIMVLPQAPSMAAKVKMSSAIVSQVVAEREKEAELFYKSSDSEDETQQSIKDSINKDTKSISVEDENIPSIVNESLSPEEDKRIRDNRDSWIGEEIAQRNQSDANASGISRGDFSDINHQDKALSPLKETSCNRDGESDTLPQPTLIESSRDLQRSSVSRKLFHTDRKDTTNNDTNDNQETIEQTIEINITALDKEKCKMKQDTSNKIDDDKEIEEKLQEKDDVTGNVALATSNNCIIEDGNDERRNDSVEVDDASQSSILITTPLKTQIDAAAENEASDGHVLGLPLPIYADDDTNDGNEFPKFIPDQKVTLKGLPGTIIDLTSDIKPNKKGINALLDRFFRKHVNTKKQTDEKSEVTVVHLQDTQNGPVPVKQIFPYTLPANIDNNELNKPGAKLKRLKEDLRLQMTLKRNEQWKRKKMEQQAEEKEEWDEEEESDRELDEQEEVADVLELSGSEESEPEEDDVRLEDRKRRKCLFADDEAEVTDDEDSNLSNAEETDNESDTNQVGRSNKRSIKRKKEYMDEASEIGTDQEEEEEEEEEECKDADMEDENESDSRDTNNTDVYKNTVKNKKDRKAKLLMRESQDLSDVEASNVENESNQINNITNINLSKKHSEDGDLVNENECNIPVYQENAEAKSQMCKTPLRKTSMLDLVSPITQLSVLNTTLHSSKKKLSEENEYLIDKHGYPFMESTQNDESFENMSDVRNKAISKKRLFDDGESIDDEYLMKLCSGNFESLQSTNVDFKDRSSEFGVTQSQLIETSSRRLNKESADIKQSISNPEANNEIFQNIREGEEANVADLRSKLRVVSSDDDDQSDVDAFFKPKKRSTKKLVLSDSEEEEEEEKEDEEDVQSYDEDNDEADDENGGQYVDYDSEENEMMVAPEKNVKRIAADFLEEEAELSGSDWDSADEDEKNMDNLEFEEGDDEHIDEHKVRNELGKMHMKQMLDEDKREVRLLKELLFEDGDLHTDGTGRERKFKWRNIDKLEDNNETPQISCENDGWVDLQEDEEEAKWSKFRRERDKFLEERKKGSSNDIEDDLHDSTIFKFGLEAVRRIESDKSKSQDVSSEKILEPSENMEPIMPRSLTDLLDGPITGKKSQIHNVMKKRSFLARGEESLARLASLAKQSESASHMVNTRNFVFQYIDLNDASKEERTIRDEDQESRNKPRKRKNMSDLPLTMKKRRS